MYNRPFDLITHRNLFAIWIVIVIKNTPNVFYYINEARKELNVNPFWHYKTILNASQTDERNRMCVESVRSELCVGFNIPYTCTEFKEEISKNKKLLKAAESCDKYKVN